VMSSYAQRLAATYGTEKDKYAQVSILFSLSFPSKELPTHKTK